MENIKYFIDNSRRVLHDLINSRSILEKKLKYSDRNYKKSDADNLEGLLENIRSKIWDQQQAIARLEFRTICGTHFRFSSKEASAKASHTVGTDMSAGLPILRNRTAQSKPSSSIEMAPATRNAKRDPVPLSVQPALDQTSSGATGLA